MSCSNPIHYVDVSVSGPHGDYPWTQVVVWVHRERGIHQYMTTCHFPSRLRTLLYTRGLAMMNAYLARMVPGSVRREVIYVRGR